MADCYRALGRHRRVEQVCAELQATDPPPDLAVEGRLVLAGSRADRGDVAGAIAALGRVRSVPNPAERHLRLWYVLADCHERAGDLPQARALFARILRHDPDAWDAAERLSSLS